MSETLNKVKNVTAEVLKLDPAKIGDGARFTEDLGGDSVRAAEWIAALELEFDIEMNAREAAGVRSVADAVAMVEMMLARKGG